MAHDLKSARLTLELERKKTVEESYEADIMKQRNSFLSIYFPLCIVLLSIMLMLIPVPHLDGIAWEEMDDPASFFGIPSSFLFWHSFVET